MPPHLKGSLDLPYLKNGTYDRIVAHLEKELEFSGLDNNRDLSIPTMTAVSPDESQENTEQTKIVCHYCEKTGRVIKYENQARTRMKNEQQQRSDPSIQNTKFSISRSFAPCPHCHWTNHPPEKSWSGLYAANTLKRFKKDHPADKQNEGQKQGNLTLSGPISILKNPLNWKKPRLQWADYTPVGQCLISDLTIVYHSHVTLDTGIPSVVW